MSDLKFVVDYTDIQKLKGQLDGIAQSAQYSAGVFVKEFSKVERELNRAVVANKKFEDQLQKTATANQAAFNKVLGVGTQYKDAAQNIAALEKQLIQNDKAWAKETQRVEQLKLKYNPLYRAVRQYENAIDELKEANEAGALSTQRMEAAVEALTKEYQAFQSGTAGWSNQFVQEANRSGKSLNRFGMYSQQFGYQFSDFVVQVQGGTSAFVAFGQQGAQLFGLISGPWGAALSIGAALVGAFGATWMRAKEQMEEAETGAKALEDRIKGINSAVEEYFRNQSYLERGLTPEEGDLTAGIEEAEKKLKQATAELERFNKAVEAASLTGGNGFGLFSFGLVSGLKEAKQTVKDAENDLARLRWKLFLETGEVLEKSLTDSLESAAETFEERWTTALDNLKGGIASWQSQVSYNSSEVAPYILEMEKLFEASQKLTEEIGQSAKEVLILADVDISKGVSDAAKAAAVLAANLKISLQEAINMINLQESKVYSGRGSAGMPNRPAVNTLGSAGIQEILDRNSRRSRGGSGKSKETEEEYLGQLQREIALKKSLVGVFGTEADILTRVQQLKEQVIDKELKISDTQLEKIAKEEIALQEAISKQENLYESFSSSISSGLMDMVTGAQSVEDAFKGMIYNILETLYQQSVLDPIAQNAGSFLTGLLGFANGGVIQSGKTIPFASGGIVHGASTFPMSRGKGLVGEAGPEAILPLTRNSRGQLGVQTTGGNSGGGATVVQVQLSPELIGQIIAEAEMNTVQIVNKTSQGIVNKSVQAVMDKRRRGGSMKAAFG